MYKYLFGPVPSRRLGISLGIDLVPKKVCSLNCVYCEVGKTTKLSLEREEYILYKNVIQELDDFMSSNPKIDFITFSGSGEPTLNSKIGELIIYIKLRYPDIKLAVLTNGTLLYNKSVRDELSLADVILPSLDAASQKVFNLIDRPVSNLNIETYIQGLVELRKEFKGQIWLEVLFLKNYNDSIDELMLLKDAIKRIHPDSIQLNTLDRPGTVTDIQALTKKELQNIIELWGFENAQIIAAPIQREAIKSYNQNIEDLILNTIKRRPSTLDDLKSILSIHINEINKYLSVLEESGKIRTEIQNRGVFYLLS